MLKSAKFTYIQPHEETVMEFHPGLNVITGASHKGKSSLTRGFKWCVLNKPYGADYRSRFAEGTVPASVECNFEEGMVRRARYKQNNFYQTRVFSEEESDKLKALRGSLPEEILAISGMDDINIQGQFDPFFMLQDSGGDIAKRLNETVGLESIDVVINNVNRIISKARTDVEYWKKYIAEWSEKLKEYKDLDKIESLIKETELSAKRVDELKNKEHRINQLIQEIKAEEVRLKTFRSIVKMKDDFLETEKALNRVQDLQKRFNTIQSIYSSIKRESDVKNSAHSRVLNLKQTYIDKLKEHGICPVCGSKVGKDILKHLEETL